MKLNLRIYIQLKGYKNSHLLYPGRTFQNFFSHPMSTSFEYPGKIQMEIVEKMLKEKKTK
jgi:hypothetical protein